MPNLLFDTHAFVTLFERQSGWETIREYTRSVDDDECSGFVPTVVITEIMYLYAQQEGSDLAKQRVEQIISSKMKTLPLDENISLITGTMKKPGISLADACIGATAHVHGLSVISGDRHFDQMGVSRIGYP
ncbi:MAG: PIN domain-containing protein [Methanobacteriota archaeon]